MDGQNPPVHAAPRMASAPRRRHGFFRAVAVDYDGTITADDHPDPDLLTALAEARTAGLVLILATGRIVAELNEAWPEVLDSVDFVVAENGAILTTRSWRRLLATPVDPALDTALIRAGISFRRGEVILAAAAADEAAILTHVRALHLGCQTVANRGELMVLPAGVSKASGLHSALGQLGLSFHNTIAIGDAENDLPLLEMSELGVAVGNAVESLKARADLVLDRSDGVGVAAFLRGDVVRGRRRVHSRRWGLRLGRTDHGRDVTLPGSQLNLLIAGATGAGKSYLAGLLAEQLVQHDYSLLVIDPEGDHAGLSHLSGALIAGGGLSLPDPDDVLRLLHHRYASVIVDLSPLGPDARDAYQRQLLTRVEAHRRATGLPHWVLLDEADRTIGRITEALPGFDPAQKGYCYVTWKPSDLAAEAVASLDAVVAVCSSDPEDGVIDLAAAVGDIGRAQLGRLLLGRADRAVLTRRDAPGQAEIFTVAERLTPHLRHLHKYDRIPLEAARSFHFRRGPGELTGARAGNLVELEDELARCDRAVLRHHCPRNDFSRWVADVFHDRDLAGELAAVETSVTTASPVATVEQARLGLLGALQMRLIE